MGESYNRTGEIRRRLWRAVVTAFALAFLASSALAQRTTENLRDPMQPSGIGGAAPGDKRPAVEAVQVILTSPGRKLALVNGEVVPLGARDELPMHPRITKTPSRDGETVDGR